MNKTDKLIKSLAKKWEAARSLQNKDAATRKRYEQSFTTANGSFSWNNSSLVMLADFVDVGGYEADGSIIGLSKDGRLMWEYQSHCSCNGFDDSASATELKHEHILEKKTFELRNLPVDWEERIQESIEQLLRALNVGK